MSVDKELLRAGFWCGRCLTRFTSQSDLREHECNPAPSAPSPALVAAGAAVGAALFDGHDTTGIARAVVRAFLEAPHEHATLRGLLREVTDA